ncbi:MAG: vWA domain-containing protein, partial [Ginsengibacter sp.]
MTRTNSFLLPILLSLLFFSFYRRAHHSSAQTKSRVSDKPVLKPKDSISSGSKIQVVFALDATGSMSGLIGAAKEKIWSIAGSLAQADPAPKIEIGLLFYRDRGDAFITKHVELSDDLDEVYEKLMQIDADGGGDSPESVNQGLNEAVNKFRWDSSIQTYKTIFLVGDCPPHMDYGNDVKYPVTCTEARQKDIVLNTILMGNDEQAKRIWREIAAYSQGSYTQVNMDANDIVINTPYDEKIANISDQLDDNRLYYGNESEKAISSEKIAKSKIISGASRANIKAQRAEYNSSKVAKDVYYGNKELLESYRLKSVDLESIKKEELPESMKGMTTEQMKKFVENRIALRDSLNKALTQLTQKRQIFIENDLARRNPGIVDSSFTNQIYKSIQKQTEKKKIY